MERFIESLRQKKALGQLDVAIEQCKKSAASFVRSYVAYCMLQGWDPEQVILQVNREILDNLHDEEMLKKDIKFYVSSLESIPAINNRIKDIQTQRKQIREQEQEQ